MSWDPAQYLRFADERLRPALDLLARVPLDHAEAIVDLGCGTGNMIPHLRRRWPAARITAVDRSAEMLVKASAAEPGVTWLEADIAAWRPEAPVDLLYSNAALHWLADHPRLFPRLLGHLAPGGVLAVQMPQTGHGRWREILRETAASGPWAEELRPFIGPGNVLASGDYHGLVHAGTRGLDIWESTYLHRLDGADPVAEWTKGAALRPLLAALSPVEAEAFYDAYRTALRAAYPPEPDGATLLPFRRLFIVATL